MSAIAIFLDVTNQNLLLGFVPESIGLLLFGIGLVVLTVILRRIFSRIEDGNEQNQVKAKN
ncbi:MAG: hypothetical protein ABWZ66_03985 [Pyrinomonadaceae bacterium]